MMVRTQISLDDEDLRRAKARAAELGISLAEYVRRALRRELQANRKPGDISELFGIVSSGRSDGSSRVDEIVEADIVQEYQEMQRRHFEDEKAR